MKIAETLKDSKRVNRSNRVAVSVFRLPLPQYKTGDTASGSSQTWSNI